MPKILSVIPPEKLKVGKSNLRYAIPVGVLLGLAWGATIEWVETPGDFSVGTFLRWSPYYVLIGVALSVQLYMLATLILRGVASWKYFGSTREFLIAFRLMVDIRMFQESPVSLRYSFFACFPAAIGVLVAYWYLRIELLLVVLAVVVFVFAYHVAERIPPAILLLAVSSKKSKALHDTMSIQLYPLHAIALLRPLETSDYMAFDFINLRLADGAPWQECVHELSKVTPLIVVDTTHKSEYLDLEKEIIQERGLGYKTLFVYFDVDGFGGHNPDHVRVKHGGIGSLRLDEAWLEVEAAIALLEELVKAPRPTPETPITHFMGARH